MTITRTVGGEQLSFELTESELANAYFEQQYKFDQQDVMDLICGWDDDDVLGVFGVTVEEYGKLSEDIATEMRRNMDKYDMDFDYARDEAVRTVVRRNKETDTTLPFVR